MPQMQLTALHLKDIISGLEPLTRFGRGSAFALHHNTLKSDNFPSRTGQVAVSCEHSCMYLYSNTET